MNFENIQSWHSGVAILEDNVFEQQKLPDSSVIAERRKDPRFSVQVPLTYKFQNYEENWRSVETLDVSNTGIRLFLNEPAGIGTKLDLEVQLPGAEKKMQVEGTIVWTRPSEDDETFIECGIAFENLKKVSGKARLLSFISDKLCRFALKHKPKDLFCYPADTFDEVKEAYQLLYKEYLYRGYCPENDSKMHYSFYCMLPESRTFLLKRKENLLGTLSLIIDSPCGLPMESIFREDIQSLRSEGRRIAEVSLLALDHEMFKKKSFSLTDFQKLTGTFSLFKIMFDYARFVGQITDLVIAVHPKHEDLYTYLTFEKIGEPRSYRAACGKPALPMRLNVEKSVSSLPSTSGDMLKYFIDHVTDGDILEKQYKWEQSSLRELLLQTNEPWYTLPQPYRNYIKQVYPDFIPTPN